MPTTAWVKSGLPSDRIRPGPSRTTPSPRPQDNSRSKSGGKAKDATPKSFEVRRLERLVAGLRNERNRGTKDPKGGCFCQARSHILSEHTPNCLSCGLVLCSINPPYHACPHCGTPLLSVVATEELLSLLDLRIAETIAKEIEAREREIEEQRKAIGAFPTLGASVSGSSTPVGMRSSSPALPPPPSAPPQTRKVLSLNPNTKKVTISSFQPAPPKPATPTMTDDEKEEAGVIRIGPPPKREPPGPAKSWREHAGGRMLYVRPPPPPKDVQNPDQKGKQKSRRKRGGEKKGQAKKNPNQPPEAGRSSVQQS
ncbi:hypothetical protein SISSUDRAFT_983691 [Sistotremastrum suecicum HHB10207 ss-3]|uniref:TRIP4/RQT4 C2HC5-type zinc finger domain-containing protein n=1 Tax=Sistotremastrum suecicum HHB10207 ss-3 TaxID=1314776 RepID=A0A166F279_9AGAM|nr:hypothetical protein SISSUDRAFT_983691 [Sistotremastrum suecicum HHB10207 ss-3]